MSNTRDFIYSNNLSYSIKVKYINLRFKVSGYFVYLSFKSGLSFVKTAKLSNSN